MERKTRKELNISTYSLVCNIYKAVLIHLSWQLVLPFHQEGRVMHATYANAEITYRSSRQALSFQCPHQKSIWISASFSEESMDSARAHLLFTVSALLLITALLNLQRAHLYLGCLQLTLVLHHNHLYVVQVAKMQEKSLFNAEDSEPRTQWCSRLTFFPMEHKPSHHDIKQGRIQKKKSFSIWRVTNLSEISWQSSWQPLLKAGGENYLQPH